MNQYRYKQFFCFCVVYVFCITSLFSQTSQAAKEAYTIYRMAEKLHVNARPLNETFSASVYTTILDRADPSKTIFLSTDVQELGAFKNLLHKQIIEKKADFIMLFTKLYQQRLLQIDTLYDALAKTPFNIQVAEKYSTAEDSAYSNTIAIQKNKLQKRFKLRFLSTLSVIQDTLLKTPPALLKKKLDSIEPIIRKKIIAKAKRNIQILLQSPGGIEKLASNMYCRAIALAYDPHSAYMSATDKDNFEEHLGRQNKELGISFDEDEDGNVMIEGLTPGSSAFKSGLLNAGDKIISIQWDNEKPIDVSDASAEEVMRILSISNQAKLTITVKKADGTKRQTVLNKEVLNNSSDEEEEKVRSYIIKAAKTIGYISLPSFYIDWENENSINGCANDVAKEVVKLKKEGIDALIVDVRYNGGGSVKEAVELAGIFIDAGPVAQFKRKEAKPITLKDVNRGTIYDGPLLIMVNGFSASASELLAATLQDYNRALIVGSPTYGKATGQIILPVDTTVQLEKDYTNVKANAYLKLTVSQIYRVNGSTAQFSGVTPHIIVPDLSMATEEKEKNEVNALTPNTIEANKYYVPLKPLNIQSLQAIAATAQQKNPYYDSLKFYLNKPLQNKQNFDIPLKLQDYFKWVKQNDLWLEDADDENWTDSSFIKNIQYTIVSPKYNQTNIKLSEGLQKQNEYFIEYLLADPQLNVCIKLLENFVY